MGAKWLFVAGSSLAGLGVALGAFGAHALKGKVPDNMLANWNTGVLYHLVHALALLVLAVAADRLAGSAALVGWSGRLFVAGIVLFSGSLYVMAVTGVTKLGAITPLGGIAFLAAWTLAAVAAWKAL